MDLQRLGFDNFSPRNVNQDLIEKFFRMVRSHARRNINPTCMQFESSFKALFINNLTSAETVKGNCEHDNASALFALHDFAVLAQNLEDSIASEAQDSTEQYVIFDRGNSTRTSTSIEISQILSKLYADVRFKYCCTCVSDLRNFTGFDIIFEKAHSNLDVNMPFFCFRKRVVKNLMMPLLLIVDFSFVTCTEHVESLRLAFLRVITVEYVRCWCRNINKLLKGKYSVAKAQTYLAKEARKQYVTKLKKKDR